jgi:hypothetical protein
MTLTGKGDTVNQTKYDFHVRKILTKGMQKEAEGAKPFFF